MAQNIDLRDLKITDEEMKRIDALDLGHGEPGEVTGSEAMGKAYEMGKAIR